MAGQLRSDRRIMQGGPSLVTQLSQITQGDGGINSAFIERLNATFRQRLSALVRRTYALAGRPETLAVGRYVLGWLYNFCTCHHSLRRKLSVGAHGHHSVRRNPDLAANWLDRSCVE